MTREEFLKLQLARPQLIMPKDDSWPAKWFPIPPVDVMGWLGSAGYIMGDREFCVSDLTGGRLPPHARQAPVNDIEAGVFFRDLGKLWEEQNRGR